MEVTAQTTPEACNVEIEAFHWNKVPQGITICEGDIWLQSFLWRKNDLFLGLKQRLILSGSRCWFTSTNPRIFNCCAKHSASQCYGNEITWITCFLGLLCIHCKAILYSRIFSLKYFWSHHYFHPGECSMSSTHVFICANIHCAAHGPRNNLEYQELLWINTLQIILLVINEYR